VTRREGDVFDCTGKQRLHYHNDSAAPARSSLGRTSPLNGTCTPNTIGETDLHICFVTETYAPEINGVALTLARLVKGLAGRGSKISIVRPYQQAFDSMATSDAAVTLVPACPYRDTMDCSVGCRPVACSSDYGRNGDQM
jgi:hypothetical protein